MLINTTCPHCDAEVSVEVNFGEPAKTYGPPEHCHPGSSDEIEPADCPTCGKPLDEAAILEKAADYADDAEMERALSRQEQAREDLI